MDDDIMITLRVTATDLVSKTHQATLRPTFILITEISITNKS